MVLQVTKVNGGYTHHPVIKDISFSIASGELVALIGLNGAGKSTTIKHIMGLMQAFSGEISILNQQLATDATAYRRQLTYIPETPILYAELTLKEHLEMTALAYGLDSQQALQKAQTYLERFKLQDKLDWFPAYFSKGMKQKVMIICAFMVDVPLYIIDEPFLGLDPIAIHHLLEMIDEKRQAGAAVLMSTHVLSTAEQRCDRFIFMHEGHIRADGTLAMLQEQFGMPNASLDDMYIEMAKEAI